jgi:hypothetical protein
MFIEDLDELPENLRGDFVESEFEGKKGFQHKSTIAMLNAMKNAKDEKATYKSELDDLKKWRDEFEANKASEIEAARAEALEKARTSGDVATIEERYKQQMADLEKRKSEELTGLKSKLDELTNSVKTEKRNAVVADLASELAAPKGSKAFKMLIASRVDVDPSTGELTFLDENGSATSLDLEGFKSELEKDELFAPLLKSGIVTTGGGNVSGSGSGAGMNRKFNEMSSSELVALKKQDPSRYERLKNDFYGN